MSYGIKAISQSADEADFHRIGYATARATANTSVFEVWNGSTSAARVFRIELDGKVVTSGTVQVPNATAYLALDAAGSGKISLLQATSVDAFKGGADSGSFTYRAVTIASGGVAALSSFGSSGNGLLIVTTGSNGNSAIFGVRGANNATVEIADPSGTYSTVKGTASSVCIYYDTTNARYEVQNNTAGTTSVGIMSVHAA